MHVLSLVEGFLMNYVQICSANENKLELLNRMRLHDTFQKKKESSFLSGNKKHTMED